MSEFTHCLMFGFVNNTEIGFKSAEAINDIFELDRNLTQEQSESIRSATLRGTPMYAVIDPFHKQINGLNYLILTETEDEMRREYQESGMNI